MIAIRSAFAKHILRPPWRLPSKNSSLPLSLLSTNKTNKIDSCSFSSSQIIPSSKSRSFSSINSSNGGEPSIDIPTFQRNLSNLAPSISKSLSTNGYYITPTPYAILPPHSIATMRAQSIQLRNNNERFEQSWSEKIDNITGKVTRFDKEGVYACEPDGRDYDTAPDLILYLSVMLQTLPDLLNGESESAAVDGDGYGLSASSFNAKLAVTCAGGSVYPLHIDNPQGVSAGDTRKLTCILYMNPGYRDEDGGQLRIHCGLNNENNNDNNNAKGEEGKNTTIVDITPDGGRMILFWSDVIPHEVLPTGSGAVGATATTATASDGTTTTTTDGSSSDEERDRYALTVWIPTDHYHTIHDPNSKFAHLGVDAFPVQT